LARQAAARRVVPAARSSVRLSARPQSEASLVRRDAAVAPSSCLRQEAGRPSAALLEPAWWQEPAQLWVPAAAWRQPAGAAAAQETASPSEMKAAAGVA
jgi:hypothetical protein